MDFKELEKLVITGHDVEFEYDNNNYAIVKSPNGFHFSDKDKNDGSKVYTNPMELLLKTNIDGKNLNDISGYMNNINVY